MKKNKLLIFEQIERILEISGIDGFNGKDLIIVDIQPEYIKAINFLGNFISFLNENHDKFNSVVFLYNGYDTLGMINEGEYISWWLEEGLSEEVIDSSKFYDKGYAFFRYCIDEGIDDDQITNLIKYMIENGVNDSRDLDEEFWDGFINEYGDEDIRELLEFSGDCINIPDLMDELSDYNNIVMCGGGIYECLKEVEIALNALGKKYQVISRYTY